ncbi:MAG: hypothetical protein Q8K58_04025 [Acidimicrobiales bacterium]|nr:hypothetical protein [Acidimicrobiales bacterium]
MEPRDAGATGGSGRGSRASAGVPPLSDASDRVAAIVRDGLDIMLSQGRIWFDRSKQQSTWSPEDVVGDSTNLVEHVTPLVERSLDLSIELLRPWAQAFEARKS